MTLRRALLPLLALPLLALAATLAVLSGPSGQAAPLQHRLRAGLTADNPVALENQKPGSGGWDASPSSVPGQLAVYASELSVAPGEPVHLHVSAGSSYSVSVYRLGWYGGQGGRLLAQLPAHQGSLQLEASPDPVTGEVKESWPVTDVVQTGSDWVSGYYVAKVESSGQGAVEVPFVVRESPNGSHAAILVQVPVNTWQAYNPYGGKSLYNFGCACGVAAVKVSFDRPYGVGAQGPFIWEIQSLRWLESQGYDIAYQTDYDTDQHPESLLEHRLVMTLGHGEYWTKAERDGFEAAIAQGTNVAFLGSNTGYWQVRYEDGGRTLVGYKDTVPDPVADPAQQSILFRELGRPECQLLGVMHTALRAHQDGLIGYTVPASGASDPWMQAAGFKEGDFVPDIVGNEWDNVVPGCVPPGARDFTVLLHYQATPGVPSNADAVRYTAPSGARVFASGAQMWGWGLDTWAVRYQGDSDPASPKLQQLMRVMLQDLTRPEPPQALYAKRSPRLMKGKARVHVWGTLVADPRLSQVVILRHSGPADFAPSDPAATTVCTLASAQALATGCRDSVRPGLYRYEAVASDGWGSSDPAESQALRVPRR